MSLIAINPFMVYVEMAQSHLIKYYGDTEIMKKDPHHFTKEERDQAADIYMKHNRELLDSLYYYDITYLMVGDKTTDDIMTHSDFVYTDTLDDDHLIDSFLSCYFKDTNSAAVIGVVKKERYTGDLKSLPGMMYVGKVTAEMPEPL
jgi:hypothetical protein